MAKNLLFLHIGPQFVEVNDRLCTQLAAVGVRTPDVTQADLDRAYLEIRRLHKGAGLKRKDVEGAWAKVCRRTFRTRTDAFISQPGFCRADDQQAALALDGMHGLTVHLLVSTGADSTAPGAWTQRVKPGRVHVLAPDLSPDGFAEEVVRIAQAADLARRDKRLLKRARRTSAQADLAA